MTKSERLNELFNIARMNSIVKTQKDFAELLNTDATTVSRSLKDAPKSCAETLVVRAENELQKRGISITITQSGCNNIQNNSTAGMTMEQVISLIDKKLEEEHERFEKQLKEQQEHYERIIMTILNKDK